MLRAVLWAQVPFACGFLGSIPRWKRDRNAPWTEYILETLPNPLLVHRRLFWIHISPPFRQLVLPMQALTLSKVFWVKKYLLSCRLNNFWSNSKLPNIWYVLWQFLTYTQKTHSNPFKPVQCSSLTLGTRKRSRSYPYSFKTRSKHAQKAFKSRSEPVRIFKRFPPLQFYETLWI